MASSGSGERSAERLVAAAAIQTREIKQLLPCAGKPMAAAILAREVMQLLPCAGKPVVAAKQAREIVQLIS